MAKFSREDIEQYYKILGLDPNEEGLIYRDTINLQEIGDLYKLNDFEKKLPYTAEDLSKAYSLLVNMTRENFWYASRKRQQLAFQSALDVLDDLTKFELEVEDNPDMTMARMHNLKTAIIRGLCCSGDIITFRMYQKNSSFDTIYTFITNLENEEQCKEKLEIDEEEKTPDELKKLYYLILYSKFQNFGRDYELFDGLGNLTLPKVRNLVKRNVRENAALSDQNSEERTEGIAPVLRLEHYKNLVR